MIIGISGKMGTGKDYFIEHYLKPYIENKLNKKCLILSFADMIKVNLMVHNNINLNELYGRKTPEIRRLLQLEGTEKGRFIHGDNIWVNYVKAWSELHISRGIDYILISDVRFKNEYDFIKKSFNNTGIILRIDAPNRNEKRLREESINDNNYEQIKNHLSEIDLDDFKFDIIINNDNNIDINIINDIINKLGRDFI